MDGLSEMTGAGRTLLVAGRSWQLRPLRLCDWGEIEQCVVAARADPVEAALEKLAGLPELLQHELLGWAYDQVRRGARAGSEEVRRWLRRPEGRGFAFWLAVRQAHPALGREEAEKLLLQAVAAGQAGVAEVPTAAEVSALGN